jgi:hypothetical protein
MRTHETILVYRMTIVTDWLEYIFFISVLLWKAYKAVDFGYILLPLTLSILELKEIVSRDLKVFFVSIDTVVLKLLPFGSMIACLLNFLFVSNFSILASQHSWFTLRVDPGYLTLRNHFRSFIFGHGSPVLRIYKYPELWFIFSLLCTSVQWQNKAVLGLMSSG